MSETFEKPASRLFELVAWCVAAPILAVWALVSLLPMVSLIGAWGNALEALIALAFLATGALGLAAGAFGYRLLLWGKTPARAVSSEIRTLRVVAFSAYAVIWMALYSL